jgi:branched-chain amino acid transport system permease protein
VNLSPFIATGIGLGSVYGMAGMGLVILYRASGTVNFAFGAIGALAAHVAWTLIQIGVPTAFAWFVGIAAACLSSVLYGRLVSARLIERDPTVRSVATLGLALVLLGGTSAIWGPGLPRRLTLPTDQMAVVILGIKLSYTRIAAMIFAVAAALAMGQLLSRTRLGLAMRAVAASRAISIVIGVPVVATDSAAWFLSGLFAGVVGLLLSVLLVMSPIPLTFLVIPALAAAIIGGLTSMTGALIGGLVCGMAEALLTGVPVVTVYRSALPYLLALAFITVAPTRLAGQRR